MNKIIFLLIAMLFYSCDPNTSRLVLVNETSEFIYHRVLTDTTFETELYVRKTYPFETVYPNFRIGGLWNYKGWEDKINREGIDSSLHIFIFSTDQITEEMIKNREYVRLSYTVKELDSMNWTVVYRGQNKVIE